SERPAAAPAASCAAPRESARRDGGVQSRSRRRRRRRCTRARWESARSVCRENRTSALRPLVPSNLTYASALERSRRLAAPRRRRTRTPRGRRASRLGARGIRRERKTLGDLLENYRPIDSLVAPRQTETGHAT